MNYALLQKVSPTNSLYEWQIHVSCVHIATTEPNCEELEDNQMYNLNYGNYILIGRYRFSKGHQHVRKYATKPVCNVLPKQPVMFPSILSQLALLYLTII